MSIKTMKKQAGMMDCFDEVLWSSMVESVTVNSKEDIRFTFRNGTEITTTIE